MAEEVVIGAKLYLDLLQHGGWGSGDWVADHLIRPKRIDVGETILAGQF